MNPKTLNYNCAICHRTQDSGWAMGGFLFNYRGEPDFLDNWTVTVICQPCSYSSQARSMVAKNKAKRDYYNRLDWDEYKASKTVPPYYY